jgi:NAD(P)-dependent dehydrogenase (short-subunit alcohol dehydrogenase family)
MVNPILDISGRVAVVIGGTSGLGRAIALGLADAGVQTIPSGRRLDLAESVAEGIRARGVRSLGFACDVQDRASLDVLREEVLGQFGGVDILVFAAGRTFRKPTAEVPEEEWSSLLDTNVTGALRSAQAFYEPLKASGRGRIITIASLASHRAFHEVAAYGASKSALLALTQSLGCEWAKDGIRTNAILPGVFVTDLNRDLLNGTPRGREMLARTPLGRFGEAHELVGAVLFLASDAASFITGTGIPVDGGFLASGVNQ